MSGSNLDMSEGLLPVGETEGSLNAPTQVDGMPPVNSCTPFCHCLRITGEYLIVAASCAGDCLKGGC